MGLFNRKSKQNTKENNIKENNIKDNDVQVNENEVDNTATLELPEGAFVIHLLMKEYCTTPDKDSILQAFNKYVGNTEIVEYKYNSAEIAANDYKLEFADGGTASPNLFINDCTSTNGWIIDDMTRSQIRCPNSEQILNDCKYQVVAIDPFSFIMKDCKERAKLLMDYLEALVHLYPSCEAVMFQSSGKLITRDFILDSGVTKEDRFIKYTLNVRVFNVAGTDSLVIDTLGMNILGLPDIQYHFTNMDPTFVAAHAAEVAMYQFKNNFPIKDKDTIDGISDDELFCVDLQWECQYQMSLAAPTRVVLDINMGEYSANNKL